MPKPTDLLRLPELVLKRSFGLPLVMLGFFVVYFKAGLGSGGREASITDYLLIAFGFAITLIGVAFMGVELRRSGSSSLGLEMSVRSSDLEVVISQLGKNYDILRGQATQGFILAALFMVLGICVILAGAVGDLFGLTKERSSLTTIAGIVVETISGVGLILFRTTFNRLNKNSDLLLQTWRILAAFKKSDELPEDRRGQIQVELIQKLVGIGGSQEDGQLKEREA